MSHKVILMIHQFANSKSGKFLSLRFGADDLMVEIFRDYGEACEEDYFPFSVK